MTKHHILDIYGVHLHLVTDRRQLSALRKRYGIKKIPNLDPGQFGATTRFHIEPPDAPDQTHVGIYIQVTAHRGDQGELLDTVAHEVTHAACLILDSTGTEYDGNSEPLAYLIGWLVRWVWTSLDAG